MAVGLTCMTHLGVSHIHLLACRMAVTAAYPHSYHEDQTVGKQVGGWLAGWG